MQKTKEMVIDGISVGCVYDDNTTEQQAIEAIRVWAEYQKGKLKD